MIQRTIYVQSVEKALQRSPIVALIGPRQCGKTTLARQFLDWESPNYFDLEDPLVADLMANPKTLLDPLKGLVVIDEAQRVPDLFPVLRYLSDRPENPARFLILGSASPALIRQSSESLAGRLEVVEMRGFDLNEASESSFSDLWTRGGFPRSFLAENEEDSWAWRKNFIRTFLESDLGQLGFGMPPARIGRFWRMLAHYHGQIWNGNEIATALGVSSHTAKSYLEALEQTFMVRRLEPWHVNLGKRLVKSPKIYFRDSGIFHSLLEIPTTAALHVHPKVGASWEGFALEQILTVKQPEQCYFYAVHSGSELDLMYLIDGKKIGVEFKRVDSPKITRSMQLAIQDLELDELYVIYPGKRIVRLGEKVTATGLVDFLTL